MINKLFDLLSKRAFSKVLEGVTREKCFARSVRTALHKEEQSEEKPAGVKALLEEIDAKTKRLSKRSETEKRCRESAV